jgi:hypothetical protein
LKPVRKIRIILLIGLLLSLGCSDHENVELEKLSKVYVDLLIVEDFYKDTDSLEFKRNEVFNKYSINEAVYDSSFKNFEHDSEKWETFFNLSNAYLDSLKKEITPLKKPKPQRLL